MPRSWRDRLKQLLGRAAKESPEHQPSAVQNKEPSGEVSAASTPEVPGAKDREARRAGRRNASPAAPPLAINLGIDFGTSFTKVCFRDLDTEETGIVTFGGRTAEEAMIASRIVVGRDGSLSLATQLASEPTSTIVRYLKMRLAGVPMQQPLPAIHGIDLNQNKAVCALSSWFLASVISKSQDWVLSHEVDRSVGRKLQWSANVGVPVEHFDSPTIDLFRKVLGVAWAWTEDQNIPSDLDELLKRYEVTSDDIDVDRADFHAIPEIAAAVQSFLTSCSARPEIYVYFDIGGGTVDGVAFDYVNRDGERVVNFYSGKVEPIGLAAIANEIDPENPQAVEQAIAGKKIARTLREKLKGAEKALRRHVGNIVMTAKKKDPRNWQRDAIQDISRPRRTFVALQEHHMVPLIIFLGGGGAGSKWYQQTIASTYKTNQQVNAGIPPYQLDEVPSPADLEMNGLDPHAFRRFAIAYGLSVPYSEGPEVGLPSQFMELERPSVRKPSGAVDYLDSKDVYD